MLIAVSRSSSHERGEPGPLVEQRLADRVRGSAMVEVGGDQHAARPHQAMEFRVQLRHRRMSVEERQVVTGLERRQHVAEVALVHDHVAVHAGASDLAARKPHVVRVALDGIDARAGRTMREVQRGIAERGAELEDALGGGSGGQRSQQRAVAVRPGAAAMLGAMRQSRGAHLRKWISRLLLRHENAESYTLLG